MVLFGIGIVGMTTCFMSDTETYHFLHLCFLFALFFFNSIIIVTICFNIFDNVENPIFFFFFLTRIVD